ncbi:histidine phosphatase family protein [Campylobacter sp. RM16188]|uniref:SixA phosphatase family protein n=1 Tax=Campylobacter sp. RM16188 TaxID=1705725 RepID=UPI001552B565|nr:histidine phosphatase family protein [Campylobacter sp. RM16188]
MKKIYFIRHAKATQKECENDFERDLNERGKKDLALMCDRLKKHKVRAEAIFSSPAKRCVKTANKMADAVKFKEKIKFVDIFYEASVVDMLKFIKGIEDSFSGVFIVSHNDTITEICELLSDAVIGNIPTCGIFCIEFECQFSEISEHSGKALFFDYPKKHKNKD